MQPCIEAEISTDVETGKVTAVFENHMFKSLIDDVEFLKALNAAGVDNWEGYEEALRIYDEMRNEEDI